MLPGKDIETSIGYYSFETGQKPFVFTRERHQHEKDKYKANSTEELDPCIVPVTIRDGRPHNLTLDQHSFQMFDSPTRMARQDFFNEDKLKSVYFKEVAALMKSVTGAKEVIIFNHFLRCKVRATRCFASHTSLLIRTWCQEPCRTTTTPH